MKQFFINQNVVCHLQEGTAVSEDTSIVGALTKTPTGFKFEQEVKTTKPHTRYPKIFERRHISLVRRSDNSLKFSFKELSRNTDLDTFAFEVFTEIKSAIETLK